MSIFDVPKVDCHSHILDPARFPYADDVAYRPSGPGRINWWHWHRCS